MTKKVRYGQYHPNSKIRNHFGLYGCKHCGKQVPTSRHRWCSDQCVDEWKLKHHPSVQRDFLWNRDGGVCAMCGMDTNILYRTLYRIQDIETKEWICKTMGFKYGRSLWEADHTTPLVEGGSPGVDNMRTLCCPCHKAETKRLRARMRSRNRFL